MKISRDVIEDLLPAYLAGEASADTRALVESYLEKDVELARRVRAGAGELLPDDLPTQFTKEAEMQSMEKAKKLTNLKAWAMGAALFFTLSLFSFVFSTSESKLFADEGFHWLVASSPMALAVYGTLAAVSWLAYVAIRRRLR